MLRASTSGAFLRASGAALLVAASVPLVNWVVDPFWAFGSATLRGFNAVKPAATHRARLSKAYSICRSQPDVVILGSSRAEFIFDPRHPALAKIGRAYNFALAGSGVYEMRRAIEHAYFAAGTRTAIVAMDFHMFNAYRERTIFQRTVMGYDESRLVLSERDSCLQAYARELDLILFSAAALKESWHTVTNQGFEIIYRRDGARDTARMDKYTLGGKNAQRNGFMGQVRAYMEHVWFTPPSARYCFDAESATPVMQDFREMLRFARDHGIELHLVLTPEHALIQRGIVETGLWPLYERWRRELVAAIDEEARAHPGENAVALWDFAGHDPLNAEPLPPLVPAYEQHMRYWYEGTHSQLEAGNLILDKILGFESDRTPVPGFGVRIDASNIDAHVERMRAEMLRYADENPDVVAWVKEIKAEVPTHEDPLAYCIEEAADAAE